MSPIRSIRTRLLVGTGVGVAATFAIAGLLVHVMARASLFAHLDTAITEEAHALSVLVEQEDDALETDLGPTTLAGTTGHFFQLFTQDGQVVARSASAGTHHLVPAVRDAPGVTVGDATLPDGATGRQATLAFFPRQELGDPGGPQLVAIVVARDTREAEDTLARLDVALALAGVAAIALCLGLLAWVSRFGLAPVHDVARRIAAIDPAAPAPPFDRTGVPIEFAPIADRLDDLLGRLAVVLARERELTGEVAHELRTPLAGLRSTIELALSRDREPERYRSALAQCLAIALQTHRMVETLLALARLDAGAVVAAREAVALGPVLDDAIALVAARATERRIAIARQVGDVTARTDVDRIRVVVHNLIDNAVSHADDGGTIRIELAAVADRAVVRIANSGCQIDRDAAARVFERFWRGDAARTAGEHAGLGLALCKKVVDLVGGTIEVEATAGGEFVVTVSLPAG